jgi:hypothetical protein
MRVSFSGISGVSRNNIYRETAFNVFVRQLIQRKADQQSISLILNFWLFALKDWQYFSPESRHWISRRGVAEFQNRYQKLIDLRTITRNLPALLKCVGW